MNKATYDKLPDDLKAVIDANSGREVSGMFGRIQQEADAEGKAVAVARGNTIITLDEAETERWKAAARPVVDRWIEEMKGKGIDGQALFDRAGELIEKYTAK
jgi:TRAP-type C4-dicarboxylate transport system substrate-binding protein